MDVQPLAGKLGCQPTNASILEHSTCLLFENVRVMQRPIGGRGSQFGIGERRPQEIAQAIRQFYVRDRRRRGALGNIFQTVQEWRGDKRRRQSGAESFLVRDPFRTQPAIEAPQLIRFLLL